MNLTEFYAQIYKPFGVSATLTIGTVSSTITVNDYTKGVDVPDPARPGVKTLKPVARVRRTELDTAGIDRDDLDGATIAFNGNTWTVIAWGPLPSPNGEADGEIQMILMQVDVTDFALREDGGIALREDGGRELRESDK